MIPADQMYLEDPTPDVIAALDQPVPTQRPTAEGAVRMDPIESAIDAIRRGEAIIVVDDEDRENEGDLIFAASAATAALTAFMIRYTSGYICVGMDGTILDHLGLPPMTAVNEDRKGTAYAVSVDARDVVGRGRPPLSKSQPRTGRPPPVKYTLYSVRC